VAFTSESRNLLAGQPLEANFDNDVFVTDTTSGENLWVSYDYQEDEPAAGVSESPSISSDGRYISYFSSAENLVNGDSNGRMDVFRFDQATGETDLVSVATSPAGGNEHSGFPSISADGRYVAFYSVASNLVSNDTNNLADIFVRDMTAGTTTRVSVSTLGNQAQGGHSYYPAISADGRHVAFSSHANNLTLDDNNGSIQDVFAHDRQSGATQLISVSSAGDGGDAGSEFPSISGDGRYVAFHSSATTLWSGDGNARSMSSCEIGPRGPLRSCLAWGRLSGMVTAHIRTSTRPVNMWPSKALRRICGFLRKTGTGLPTSTSTIAWATRSWVASLSVRMTSGRTVRAPSQRSPTTT
jgi:Tol biopolymer transport system component